jgi:uncharacterized membrane-anchored protein
MFYLPPDHAERFVLAEEVHARPPQPAVTPIRASYLAVLVDADDRARELEHLAALSKRFGGGAPTSGATHFSVKLGAVLLKWERHGEFSGYTFFVQGAGAKPFAEPALGHLPGAWLEGLPGRTMAAVHGETLPLPSEGYSVQALSEAFDGHGMVGAEIGHCAGQAYTDFKIHDDGCSRVLLLDRSFTERQAGQMLQRLFEIEAYRMMALLALPMARRLSPRILAIERALAKLTDGIARDDGDDETLLGELTRLAAEVESGLAASQFRFGACKAYHELVVRRIAELREQRLPSVQTIEEFMARRFAPAVATCATVSLRLHGLSERVAQASALLSTRVDITRERQNQSLLASMDTRAKLQLRLQQTVEGLSVAAIAYYAAGLLGYLAKGLKAAGVHLDPDLVVGLSIPLVMVGVYVLLRHARRHLTIADAATPASPNLR